MGMVSQTGHEPVALGVKEREWRRVTSTGQEAAADATATETAAAAEKEASQGFVKAARAFFDYLPKGNTLDDETFRKRHLLLCWILALHIPALFLLGVWRGYNVGHVVVELAVPLAALLFARVATPHRRLAGFFTTAGLVYCSVVLVHLSGGMIEAHFHFFVLIGLIALYQDWIPFLWNVLFTVGSHAGGSAIAERLIFNHNSGQDKPWTWAVIHGVAVLAASAGVIVFWRSTEEEQERGIKLTADLAAAEVERQEAMSGLLVNLARRNQSLLNRQLEVITDLETREQVPDVLEDLFRLDHLATRIRRNAESLLVLSGDDPPRRWGNPVPLGDVVRAAAAEVEDYRRVEVLVNDHIDVAGRAVADLAHLLAELIENATTFSPPSSEVRIRSHLSPGESTRFVVTIEDIGIGMSDDDLTAANVVLAEAPQIDLRRATMLGFHVVARLAQRYDIHVRLAATPGGGLTALVSLPRELVSDRPHEAPPPPSPGAYDRYQRAALAWSGGRRPPAADSPASPWGQRPWFESEMESAEVPRRAPVPVAPAWLDAMPTPEWLTATAPPAEQPPPAARPTVRPSTPVLADPVLPGTRLGPVAEWVDVVGTPTRREDPVPAETTTTWWAALVVQEPAPVPDRTSRRPLAGRSQPLDVTATPAAPPPPPPPTASPQAPIADGLARRVPGSHLAPALRRDADGPEPATEGGGRDIERVRAMLSRFQASQHAGRVAADPPHARPPEENR